MKFSDFLIEAASGQYIKQISEKELLEMLTDLYKSHDNLPRYIYRGMKDIGDYAIVQGDLGSRISRNTTNHYTKIIDNNIKSINKDYPLRSKSIICSTSRETASNYGPVVYVIIPYPDTIIGKCPSDDIWRSKLKIGKLTAPIPDWNKIWNRVGITDAIDNVDELANAIIKVLDDYKVTKDKEVDYLASIFKGVKDIKAEVEEAYSIENLQMSFGTMAELNFGGDNEVWIGGKCIAIKVQDVDHVLPFIGKVDNRFNVKVYPDKDSKFKGFSFLFNVDTDEEPFVIDERKLNLCKITGYNLFDKINIKMFLFHIKEKAIPEKYHDEVNELVNKVEISKGETYDSIMQIPEIQKIISYIEYDGLKIYANEHFGNGYSYIIKNDKIKAV